MKKNTIKLISFILTLALCFGMTTALKAEEAEQSTQESLKEKYQEETDVLSYLGIIDRDIDMVNSITRAEFTEMALALGNVPISEYDYTRFYDVAPQTEQGNIIMSAAEAGIVRGGSGSAFSPDKNITVSEAVTMIMRAMGYEDMAMLRYGNSADACVKYAQSVKLLKISPSGLLKGGDAVKLLFDALELGYVDVSGATKNGGTDFTVSETTYLEKVFGMTRYTGVVTGTEYSLKISGSSYENVIEINDVLYNAEIGNDYDQKDILGKRAYFYIKEDAEKENVVVVGELPNRNTYVKILPEDLILGSSTEVVYWNESDKKTTARLSGTALVYYNDMLCLNITNADFKISDGEIVLVDNNNDKAYDYVFIREYKRYVVSNSSYGVITSLYDDWRFNVKEHKDYVLYRDGIEITSDHLGRYDEIKVMENKDKTAGVIESVKNTFEGDVTNIRVKDNKTYVTVSNYLEEREFELENYYVNAYKKGVFGVTEPKKGLSYKFAYNENGKIYAAMEAYDNEFNYGFLIGVSEEGGLDKTYQIKIYGAYGNMKIYDLADNFKINGKKTEKNKISSALLKNGQIAQMVMYKTNQKGLLEEIRTYVNSTEAGYNPNEFSLDYKLSDSDWSASSVMKLICGKYRVSPVGEVPCFYIPADRTDDDAYGYYSLYSNIRTIEPYATTADVEVYDTVRYDESTDFSKLSCLVIYERKGLLNSDNPYNLLSVGEGVGQEEKACVVRSVEEVLDQNDEARYQLTYSLYDDATEYTAYFYDNVYNVDTYGVFGAGDKTYLELEEGDIIKFGYKNPYAPIKMIDRFYVLADVRKYKDLEFENTYWYRWVDMPVDWINNYCTYGTLLFIDDEEIIVKSVDPLFSNGGVRYFGSVLEDTPTWQYNIQTGEMAYSTASLLTKGDKVLVKGDITGYQPDYVVRIVEE